MKAVDSIYLCAYYFTVLKQVMHIFLSYPNYLSNHMPPKA